VRGKIGALVLGGALSTACSQRDTAATFSQADADAIRSAANAYVAALRDAAWTTWADFYVNDAAVLAPNAPAIRGRDAMLAWARSLPPIASFRRTSDEVEGGGDVAYLSGRYWWVLAPPGAPVIPDSGKYIQIWRRQADASWKITRAIFNSDVPVP
jgi:ketosteroid isomerase-like protein